MDYLAELLVVMTDRLKIFRIRAGNVHRVSVGLHGHTRSDDDASLASLLPQESDGVVSLDAQRRRPVEAQNSSWDNLRISCSGL